jgi:peptidoglycan/LPS O-acetylase OafA/YrhL
MLARLENARTFIMTSTVLGVIALFGGLAHALSWLPRERLDYEPRIYGSSVVELLCGILLLGAAFSLRSIRPSAWRTALNAHVATLVLLALGTAVFTIAWHVGFFSAGMHSLLFVLVALNTAGLWHLRPRNPLKRAQHEIAARLY